MSLMLQAGGQVTVYKFKQTGIIALCEEVVQLVKSGEFDRRNLDPESGVFVEDDHLLTIVFKKKK